MRYKHGNNSFWGRKDKYDEENKTSQKIESVEKDSVVEKNLTEKRSKGDVFNRTQQTFKKQVYAEHEDRELIDTNKQHKNSQANSEKTMKGKESIIERKSHKNECVKDPSIFACQQTSEKKENDEKETLEKLSEKSSWEYEGDDEDQTCVKEIYARNEGNYVTDSGRRHENNAATFLQKELQNAPTSEPEQYTDDKLEENTQTSSRVGLASVKAEKNQKNGYFTANVMKDMKDELNFKVQSHPDLPNKMASRGEFNEEKISIKRNTWEVRVSSNIRIARLIKTPEGPEYLNISDKFLKTKVPQTTLQNLTKQEIEVALSEKLVSDRPVIKKSKSEWENDNEVLRKNLINSQEHKVDKNFSEKEETCTDVEEKDDSSTEKGKSFKYGEVERGQTQDKTRRRGPSSKGKKTSGLRPKLKEGISLMTTSPRRNPENTQAKKKKLRRRKYADEDGNKVSANERKNLRRRVEKRNKSLRKRRRYKRHRFHTPRIFLRNHGRKKLGYAGSKWSSYGDIPDLGTGDGFRLFRQSRFKIRRCPSDGGSEPNRPPSDNGCSGQPHEGGQSNKENSNKERPRSSDGHIAGKDDGRRTRDGGDNTKQSLEQIWSSSGVFNKPHNLPLPGSPCGVGAKVKVREKDKIGPGDADCMNDHSCFGEYQIEQQMKFLLHIQEQSTRAFEEFNKCLIKCLMKEEDSKCPSCSVLTLSLKHVGKCCHRERKDCETGQCKIIANLIKFHTLTCIQIDNSPKISSEDHQCDLDICLKLRRRVKEVCSRVTPQYFDALWRNVKVWQRIKTALHHLYRLSLLPDPGDNAPFKIASLSLWGVTRESFGFKQSVPTGAQMPLVPFTKEPSLPQMRHSGPTPQVQIVQPSNRVQTWHSSKPSSDQSTYTGTAERKVVYASVEALVDLAKEWLKLKSAATLQNGNPIEEGVILDCYREKPRISESGTRYRKGHEWDIATALGVGMFGHCYMAIDYETCEQFCLKEVPIYKFEVSEVEVLASLQHPSICGCYGALQVGTSVYILLEFIQGCSLKQHIEVHGRLNALTAMVFFKRLIEVLIYLKEKQVIHEDIKTENILLKSGTADLVLVDFGLACKFSKEKPQVPRNEPPVGAQTQWSPEKAMSKGYKYEADLWAAACVLNEMISGYPPWVQRFSQTKNLIFVVSMQSPPVDDIAAHTPPDIRDLIKWLWTVNVSERPTCDQILNHRAFRIADEQSVARVITTRKILTSGGLEPVLEIDHHPAASSTPNNDTLQRLDSQLDDVPSDIRSSSPKSLLENVWKTLTVSEKRKGEEDQEYGSGTETLPIENLPPSPISGADGGMHNDRPQMKLAPGDISVTSVEKTQVVESAPTTSSPGHRVDNLPIFLRSTSSGHEVGPPTEQDWDSIYHPHNEESTHSSGASVDLVSVQEDYERSKSLRRSNSNEDLNDVEICRPNVSRSRPVEIADTNTSPSHLILEQPSSLSSSREDNVQDEYEKLQEEFLGIHRAMSNHNDEDILPLTGDSDDVQNSNELGALQSLDDTTPPEDCSLDACTMRDGPKVFFMDGRDGTEICRIPVVPGRDTWQDVIRAAISRVRDRYNLFRVTLGNQELPSLSRFITIGTADSNAVYMMVTPATGSEDWFVTGHDITYPGTTDDRFTPDQFHH